jgi:indolepyruvate ferredoxin oxidoreductase beta subunit
MLAGLDVKMNEVHGMAQRGGSVMGQVRFGKEVHSPLVAERTARVLASFEEAEALRVAHYLAPPPEGLAVVAKHRIVPVTVTSGKATYPADIEARLKRVFPRLVYFDAVKVAVELGNIRGTNVVVVGALSKGLDLPVEVLRKIYRGNAKRIFGLDKA